MKKVVILACLFSALLCPLKGRSQCQTIYLQTFGSAGNSPDTTLLPPIADSIKRGFNGTPLAYYYSKPFCPPQGTYSLRYWSGRCDSSWLTDVDHTPGDINGYMMVVNPQKQHDLLYRDTLKGACASYSYTFTVWVANLYKFSGTKPNLILKIIDVNTSNILQSYSTGPINNGSTDGIHLNWVPVSMNFTIPVGYSSFIFEIDNNGPSSASGNDFALDDISISICKPANSISVNNQAVNSLTVCPGSPVNFSSTLSPDTLAQTAYQWQYSPDAVNWSNIAGATAKTYQIPSAAASNTGYYRQVAGAPWNVSDPDCWLLSNIIYIKVLPLPAFALSSNAPLCMGDTLKLKANNSSYTYAWQGPGGFTSASPAPVIPNITIANAGKYFAQATDASGCTNTDSINVTVNPLPTVELGNDTTLCQGSSLVLNAQNAGGSFLWNTGAVTQTIMVNSAGPYWVKVNNGYCTAADTVNVSFDTPPSVSLGNDTTLCQGNTLTLNAGNPGASYLWNTGATTQTIQVTTAGTYQVRVSRGTCTVTDSIHVNFDPPPVINFSPTTILCSGASLTLKAPNPGASYLWNNGSIADSLNVNSPGQYWLTEKRGACTVSDTIRVLAASQITVNLGPDTTICNGNTLTLNAGNSGFSYLWSTGATSQTLPVSTAGTYWVRASNGSCSAADTIQVFVDNPPVVNLGNDTTLCKGNTLALNAGNPGAGYLWNTGAVSQAIFVNNAGSYQVAVSRGVCTVKDSIRVAFDTPPSVNLGNDTTLCQGNTLTLNAGNPGATYLWNTGASSQAIFVNNAGTYQVRVNKGACSVLSDSIRVAFNTPPVVNLGRDTALCQGSTLLLNAGNPGATYLWNTGATTAVIPVSSAGTYQVKVNKGACTVFSDSITVAFSQPPVVNLGNDTTLCKGNTLTLNAANPAASYLWNTGATSSAITVAGSGTYRVQVSRGACNVSDSVIVGFDQPPVANLGNDTTLCQGNSLFLNAGNPGASYLWNTGDTSRSIFVRSAGTYLVKISKGACTVFSDSVAVAFDQPPAVNLGNDTTLCQGSTLLLNAGNPGATYLWNTGATTAVIPVNSAGTYRVKISKGACTVSSDSISVAFDRPPAVSLGNDTTLCKGNTLTLNAGNPGASYFWNTGDTSRSISINSAGSYRVKVSKGACTVYSDSIAVAFDPPLTVYLGNDTTLCQGSTLLLNAGNPGASYLWSNGATSAAISVTGSGGYRVQVSRGACTTNDSVMVGFDQPPAINLGNDTTLCQGVSLVLDAGNPGASYLWNTGERTQQISVSSPSRYRVTVQKGACTASDSVNIGVTPLPQARFGADTLLCQGTRLVLRANNTGRDSYLWNDGSTADTLRVDTGGNYWVLMKSGNCSAKKSILVSFDGPPQLVLPPDTTVCAGDLTFLIPKGVNITTYSWQDGTTNLSHPVIFPGTYTVTGYNVCGAVTATTSVNFVQCEGDIFLPNAFTPNGDGKNDLYRPRVEHTVYSFEIFIYNRWGQLVYHSTDYSRGWDGTFKGVRCEMASYVWYVRYRRTPQSPLVFRKGGLTLIR